MMINNKNSGVYIVGNTIDDKIYVGSTKNLQDRFCKHLYRLKKGNHGSLKLQKFFDEYGRNSLYFKIIELCNEDDLFKREQYYNDVLKPFFNSRIDVETNTGTKWPEESREKIKGIQRWVMTDEIKTKIGKSNSGKTRTKEQIEKYKKAKKGVIFSNEHKEKLRVSHSGKTLSEETKCKMRRKKHSLEFKEKMSEKFKNVPRSQEVRDKIKASWIIRKQKKNVNAGK